MNQYFQNMNEAYISKHYPKGSVFEAVSKTTKKVGIGVYIFFGIVFFACLAGLTWSVGLINTYKQSGETDMVDVGVVICVVFAVFALISVLPIVVTIRRSKRGAEDWQKISAEKSKLSESDIREFERQAMESDSFILKLVGGVDAALSGSKAGILTRDYVYLADINQAVLRCESLISACLVDSVVYTGNDSSRKPVHYLNVMLLSGNGVESLAEVSPESGKAFLELLLQRYPAIDTCNGDVMTEKEYEKYKKIKSLAS